MPYVFQKGSNGHYIKAAIFLTVAKVIGIASPFILKNIVNSLTVGMGAAGAVAAAGAFSLKKTIINVGLWGFSRIFSSIFLCYQMNAVTAGIQSGIRKIASASFDH